jgi:hypothetical protein
LQIFGAGMKEEVDVGVDQARHQRGVAEVDRLRFGGVGHGGADGNNLIPLHQDLPRRNNATGFDIEQARGMEKDRVPRRRSLGPGPTDKRQQNAEEELTMHDQVGLQNISRSGQSR